MSPIWGENVLFERGKGARFRLIWEIVASFRRVSHAIFPG